MCELERGSEWAELAETEELLHSMEFWFAKNRGSRVPLIEYMRHRLDHSWRKKHPGAHTPTDEILKKKAAIAIRSMWIAVEQARAQQSMPREAMNRTVARAIDPTVAITRAVETTWP